MKILFLTFIFITTSFALERQLKTKLDCYIAENINGQQYEIFKSINIFNNQENNIGKIVHRGEKEVFSIQVDEEKVFMHILDKDQMDFSYNVEEVDVFDLNKTYFLSSSSSFFLRGFSTSGSMVSTAYQRTPSTAIST